MNPLIDFQAQTGTGYAVVVSQLNEAISYIMSKAHGRKTRSQDANITPVPTPVVVSPLSKAVPMSQQPEAQARQLD